MPKSKVKKRALAEAKAQANRTQLLAPPKQPAPGQKITKKTSQSHGKGPTVEELNAKSRRELRKAERKKQKAVSKQSAKNTRIEKSSGYKTIAGSARADAEDESDDEPPELIPIRKEQSNIPKARSDETPPGDVINSVAAPSKKSKKSKKAWRQEAQELEKKRPDQCRQGSDLYFRIDT